MSEHVETEIGFLPVNWEVVQLDEIAEVIDPHPSHRAPKAVEKGFPFAGIGDIDEYGNIRTEKARQITEEFVVQQEKAYEINEYSIGYGRVGTVGKVVKLRKQKYRYAISPTLAVINPRDNVNPRYVYCLVRAKNFYHQVLNQMTGTTRPAIGIQLLRKIKVPLPTIEEQNIIANTICSLDDQVENNVNTNQTLEHIAGAIFKSWFVDFEPTRAKITAKQTGQDPELAAMATISGKALNELDQLSPEQQEQLKTTAALFPDVLVDSELGEKPVGWEVNAMEDIVDIGSAKRIFSKEYVEEGVPFYRGKEVTELSCGNNIQPEIFITNERYIELKEKSGAPKENDILITSVGTIGNTYLVQKDERFYFKDGNLTWIKEYKKEVIPYFLKIWFDSATGKNAIENIKIGSTQQAITITSINKIRLIMPSSNMHKAFNQLIESNFRKRVDNLNQIKILSEFRNSLLPKLLSGDVELKEVVEI